MNAEEIWKALEPTMMNMYQRWQCEKSYEDIKDYEMVLSNQIISKGGKMIKMLKRPFGVVFDLGEKRYQIKINSSEYSYKRIA